MAWRADVEFWAAQDRWFFDDEPAVAISECGGWDCEVVGGVAARLPQPAAATTAYTIASTGVA